MDYKRLAKLAETQPAEAFDTLLKSAGADPQTKARLAVAQVSATVEGMKSIAAGFLENCDWYEKQLSVYEGRLKAPSDLSEVIDGLMQVVDKYQRMAGTSHRLFNKYLEGVGELRSELDAIERSGR